MRRPPSEPFESFVERQIREAREAGELTDLPGQGRPLPGLDAPPDEMWWVKEKMRREDLSFVPDAIAVRRELEALLSAIPRLPESEARQRLVALDARIRKLNATVTSGPPTTVAPLDVEALLARSRK
ncbi:MAG: DUF1992 domain-containing protein [Myxococcales bacterium]